MAKVDIVVPIYNVEEYLDRNLESLMNQTFKDIRILCINDGSTDNSQKVIDEYAAKDSRFENYTKQNGGLSDARNYGLKYVDSDYVMFIDSDDFCEPTMIEESLKAMLDNQADMVVFGYNQFYTETNKKEEIKLGVESGVYSLKENPSILAFTPNAAWNKLYKTKLFINNNIRYPFGYRHQDLGTTAKLMYLSDKIAYLDKPLYDYLIDRPNNITRQIDNKIYHIIDMSKEILDYYQEQNVYEDYYDELNYLVERNLITSLRKSVKLKDKEFVFKFIDDVFEFKKKYFYRKNKKYNVKCAKDDIVYLNKSLLKFYFLYKTNFK